MNIVISLKVFQQIRVRESYFIQFTVISFKKIERNTLNKVFIRIKEKVFDIEISYSIKDWEMEVLTPEF